MTNPATRHEGYPLPRPPVTLYGEHQHQIESVLIGLLDRHPDEGEAVDRIRRVMIEQVPMDFNPTKEV